MISVRIELELLVAWLLNISAYMLLLSYMESLIVLQSLNAHSYPYRPVFSYTYNLSCKIIYSEPDVKSPSIISKYCLACLHCATHVVNRTCCVNNNYA